VIILRKTEREKPIIEGKYKDTDVRNVILDL